MSDDPVASGTRSGVVGVGANVVVSSTAAVVAAMVGGTVDSSDSLGADVDTSCSGAMVLGVSMMESGVAVGMLVSFTAGARLGDKVTR